MLHIIPSGPNFACHEKPALFTHLSDSVSHPGHHSPVNSTAESAWDDKTLDPRKHCSYCHSLVARVVLHVPKPVVVTWPAAVGTVWGMPPATVPAGTPPMPMPPTIPEVPPTKPCAGPITGGWPLRFRLVICDCICQCKNLLCMAVSWKFPLIYY